MRYQDIDGIATISENVHLQGARQKELYYEEVFTPSVMRPAYNIFVMIEMSEPTISRPRLTCSRNSETGFLGLARLRRSGRPSGFWKTSRKS